MLAMSIFQAISPRLRSGASQTPGLVLVQRSLHRLPFPPIFWRIARFLSVGLVGLAVDSGVFWGLFRADLSVEIARVPSLALATLVTWFLNRLFTFAPSGRRPAYELARYAAVALVAQGFNYGFFLALLRFDAGAHPLICLVASAVATAALSFTGQNLIAFRRSNSR